jgi:hypothetical protein
MKTSERSSPNLSTPAAPHEQLWQAALQDWDNPKVHDVLLMQAQSPAQLAALAGKYRQLLEDDQRKIIAEAQLKKIAAAAMARMDVQSAAPRSTNRGRTVWLVCLAFLFTLGTVALLRFL